MKTNRNLYTASFRNPNKSSFSSSDPTFYISANNIIQAAEKANLEFVAFVQEKQKELQDSIRSAFWEDEYKVYEITSLTLTTNNLIS